MSEIYEGNSITVNNINKSKAKIKNRGGSKQATRSGKNVINVKTTVLSTYSSIGEDDWITIERTNTAETEDAFCNFFTKLTKEVKTDTTYTIICEIKSVTTTSGGYLSITNDSTNFAFGATTPSKLLTELKAGDIIINKLKTKSDFTDVTNLLRTFVAVKPQSSVKIVFRLSVIEGDVTADSFEYESYGVSPSPEFPSEIQNVGDNINVFNKTADDFKNGETIGWAKKVILTLEPNTYYTCSTNDVVIPGSSTSNLLFGDTDSKKYTVIKGYPISYKTDESGHVPIFLRQTNIDVFFANYYIKVEKGLRATSFSAYNCGNVEITISNRNLFNPEWLVIGNLSADGQEFFQNNCARTKHISVEPNENLSITMFDTTNFRASALCFYDKDKNLIKRTVTPSNVGWDNFSTMGNCKYIRFAIAVLGSKYSTFTEEALQEASNNLQLERGVSTSYIPHKEQGIVFPLTEGQKLYEGSYLAEDGIHNIRIQDILTGEESLQKYHSDTSNGFVGFKFTMSKKHKKNADFLCTHLTKNGGNVYYNKGLGGWLPDEDRWCYICVPISILKDVSTAEKQIESMKEYLTEQYNAGTPMKFEYELATEEIIPYTQEQQNAFYQLQNIILYDGINHISTDNELGSMSVEVSKIIEDYETYISSNGFFINSQNDIHYLIDFSESELPCMAEATETTVKAAGRNGDIVLSTTYDANNFNIVCYTEDNLTQEEKVKEEMKLKKLLNSIKNKTIPLAFEKDDKFYKVKYSGAFSSTNFPKHLKFSIPLKTSESYGKDLIKKVIFGNGEETSDTFEDVGAIFTIKGPANSPIISLNDYSIEYDNPLLEGDKLIINSSNSTITHINSDGVATNAMRYYNHQFPKIENGKNVLKVLSGVNEANVSVEWYDYKF